ncbi:MAG: DNA primase small subunit PriS [Candidatus Bathyarchaeia archaeon]
MDKAQAEEYVKGKFREYYLKNPGSVRPPSEMEKREYGFLLFVEKQMVRHKGFKSGGDLRSFIEAIVPSDVYYSSAYYMNPEESMDRKGWLGADLVFDIDADHLNTPCKLIHDRWTCGNCGTTGAGAPPERCLRCGATNLREETWICELCLNQAKEETEKLLEMLTDDLGFSGRDIHVYFTGHRGYHVHVRNERVRTLRGEERKEIVDYVVGLGLNPTLLFSESPVSYEHWGWRRRLERELLRLLFYAEEEELNRRGLSERKLRELLDFRRKIKEESVKPSTIRLVESRFKSILEAAVAGCSAHIDTVVTTDVHRLVRLPGTLNGKTGLRVVEVEEIDKFDPLREGLSLRGGEETVYIADSPKFRVGDMEYGPYKGEVKTLPVEAALLLICKGKAYPTGV